MLAEKIEEDEDDATPAKAPAASPAKAAASSSSYGMGDKVWIHLDSRNITYGMVVSAWVRAYGRPAFESISGFANASVWFLCPDCPRRV